jgi:haloalkane dehalogenase
MIMQGATTTDLPQEILDAYEAPFPTPESKAGAQAFPLLVPLTEDQPGVSEMRAVQDELSRWEKPVLIAFSDSDPVFPYPQAGQVFVDMIPSADEQVRIEGAAHFLQEDRGPEIVDAMLAAFGQPIA